MSLILDAAATFRAQLRNREDTATSEMARRWLEIEHALQDSMDALVLELSQTQTPTETQILQSQRYLRLRQQIAEQVTTYRHYASQLIQADQTAALNMAIQHSAALINVVAQDVGLSVDFDRLPIEAVQAIVGQSGDGSPLAVILTEASKAGDDALRRQLIAGLALGRNPKDLAKDVMRKGLGATFTRVSTIYRTEVLRAYRYTSQEAYKASGVVTGYKRLSARDSTCCLGCLMSDGQIYDLASNFDEHPAGRCSILPIVKDFPLKIGTGQDWFKGQPEATQKRMLGQTRYDLWQGGDVSLSDLVARRDNSTWGGALVPATVEELKGRAGNG